MTEKGIHNCHPVIKFMKQNHPLVFHAYRFTTLEDENRQENKERRTSRSLDKLVTYVQKLRNLYFFLCSTLIETMILQILWILSMFCEFASKCLL